MRARRRTHDAAVAMNDGRRSDDGRGRGGADLSIDVRLAVAAIWAAQGNPIRSLVGRASLGRAAVGGSSVAVGCGFQSRSRALPNKALQRMVAVGRRCAPPSGAHR